MWEWNLMEMVWMVCDEGREEKIDFIGWVRKM